MAWDAPPAFQLYHRDWLLSTRTLAPEARCLHFDLLCLSWDRDGIPENPADLMALLALTKGQLKKGWSAIEDKWPMAEEGTRRNPRQEKQRAEVQALREKRRKAGQKSGEARNK